MDLAVRPPTGAVTRSRLPGSILAALLLAGPAFAGPAQEHPGASVLEQYRSLIEQETLRFTITQAVDVAVELHPEVRATRERFVEFEARLDEVRANYLPRLDLALSATETRDPGFSNSPFFSRLLDDPDAGGGFPGGDASSFGGAFTFGTYFWDLQLSQTLWSQSWLRQSDGVRASREREALNLAELQNRIARDTVQRLHSWVLASRTRDVLREAVRVRERALEVASDRLRFGSGERLDVLRARVQLARLRREVRATEEDLRVEQAGVNALVGRDQDWPIEVLDSLELPNPLPRLLPVPALVELATATRPQLDTFAKDRELLRIEEDLLRAEMRPEVQANASFGINSFTVGNTTEFHRRNWNVGVTVNWTLFDGLGTRAQVAGLRSQRTRNEWEQAQYESTLEVQLRDQVRRWNDALAAIEDARLALEESREAHRVASAEQEAGAGIELMVMEAGQLEREVELDMLRSTRDALSALAEVKFLVGYSAGAPHSLISDTAGPAGGSPHEEEDRDR